MGESCCQSLEIERYNCRVQQQQTKAHENRSEGTGAVGNTGLTNSTSAFHDDSAMLCEILSRLPVKSLVRFKCVCKCWRFFIEEDSYFIDLHLNQSKKHLHLLAIVIKSVSRTMKVEFVTVDLILEGKGRAASTASVDKIWKFESPCSDSTFFGPVNGLIGCHQYKNSCICICNISTQQVSPWIESKSSKDEKRKAYYEMGFDPATKKHKVICIWQKDDSNTFPDDNECKVLTVGDNKWRRVELPPLKLKLERGQRRHTRYLNGFIYYCTSKFMNAHELGYDKIVAFDVGAEKFREIAVPDFILNQPKHVYGDGSSCISFIELEGRLALVSRMRDYTAKVWIFHDVQGNKVEEKNSSTSSSTNENWTEYPDIELPYLRRTDRYIFFSFSCRDRPDNLRIP